MLFINYSSLIRSLLKWLYLLQQLNKCELTDAPVAIFLC